MIKTINQLKAIEFKYYRNSILFLLVIMRQLSFAQQMDTNNIQNSQSLTNEKSQFEEAEQQGAPPLWAIIFLHWR